MTWQNLHRYAEHYGITPEQIWQVWQRFNDAMNNPAGVHLIQEERARQIVTEGYTAKHDTRHVRNQLSLAACAYAMPEDIKIFMGNTVHINIDRRALYPSDMKYAQFKASPVDRVKELAKAGALIAADIDRIQASLKIDENI